MLAPSRTDHPTIINGLELSLVGELRRGHLFSGLNEVQIHEFVRQANIQRLAAKTQFALSNRERLVHALTDLALNYGQGPQNRRELGIKLSHQDLAQLIGSTRQTVTVVLGRLQQEGLLEIRRRRITLTSAEALAQEVNRSLPIPCMVDEGRTNFQSTGF